MKRSWIRHRTQILDALAGEGTCRHRHWTLASAQACADEMAQEWTIVRVVRRYRLSRPCYDKAHRCPGWIGGGMKYPKGEDRCLDGRIHVTARRREAGPEFNDHPGAHPWRFGQCDRCEVVTWPVAWTWLAPANVRWRVRYWWRDMRDRFSKDS